MACKLVSAEIYLLLKLTAHILAYKQTKTNLCKIACKLASAEILYKILNKYYINCVDNTIGNKRPL